MENKINIADLLKDCPKDMELDCTMYDNLYFDSVNADYYGTINCYTLIDGIKTSINFTKYGTFNNHTGAKCVIFPKGKTTWEGFHRPFKDGDIVATISGKWIGMINEPVNNAYKTYITMYDEAFVNNDDIYYFDRFATEEEKAKLFQAIKANGYEWNTETNTFEKLPKFKDRDMFPNTEDDVRRRSTIQVLEYARSLDAYNQYGKAVIDTNIAWLEKNKQI